MFDHTSRYTPIEDARLTLADGRTVAYKRRRMLPPGAQLAKLGETTVEAADRLDLIAARTLGDPEHFWRICDANDALDPHEMLRPGRRLTVPLPQP
jgi:nucleoid-associated protein YgaU